MLQTREKPLEHFACIPDESSVDLHVLVDLGAVDLDVNLASFLGVGAQIAGDAVVKTHADGDQQIGFLNGVIDPGFAVHAHHAKVQGIVGGEASDAEERHGHGQIAGVDELVEGAHRPGNHDAVAGENQRALGIVEQLDSPLKIRRLVVDALAFGRQLRCGSFPVEVARGLLRVLGDIDEHRAGPAGVRNHEGFANGACDVVRARYDHIVLGNRHGNAGDVDFLEGVGAEQFAADLSGDANHWRGIQHGGRYAGNHVGRARAGGSHGHAYAAAGSRVAVGHVGGALFVAHENVVQLGFAKRVVHRKNRSARIAKNVAHPEPGQRFAENFRSGELHDVLETVCAAVENDLGTAVMAPKDEEETSNAYFAITPLVKRGCGAFQVERRRWISASVSSTLSVRLGISKAMISPSFIAAMG